MTLRTLYVATTNAGKLRDFAAAAQAFGLTIGPLPGLREMAEPVEDGETFEANARKKAEHYSRLAPGLYVLADDSGLEVDALDGAPGVRSARFAQDAGFAGEPGMSNDERNNAFLLARLAATSGAKAHVYQAAQVEAKASTCLEPDRTARYRCALALARHGEVERVASGSVEGVILREPRGDGGFGYDPLFYVPELQRAMGEIDLETKQRVSHRGKALRELLQGFSSGECR